MPFIEIRTLDEEQIRRNSKVLSKICYICDVDLNENNNLLEESRLFTGISLVAQWLRIRLPMQGTPVRSLVWKDPIC